MRLTDNIQALVDAVRKDRGISMNALAKEIGINQPTLLRIYEGESKEPRIENLAKIARYFRIKRVDDLYNADLTGGGAQEPDLLPSSNTQPAQSEVIFTSDNVVAPAFDEPRRWPFSPEIHERIMRLGPEDIANLERNIASQLETIESVLARAAPAATRSSKRAS